MKHIKWIIAALIFAGLLLSACGSKSVAGEIVQPARLEPIEGTKFSRVILTEKAAQRIDIQTAQIQGNTVPYAAVIYDTEGNTWVYSNPKPLTFVRQPIVIDHIEGDLAVLTQGLDSATIVVTVGVSELYGAETGVSK